MLLKAEEKRGRRKKIFEVLAAAETCIITKNIRQVKFQSLRASQTQYALCNDMLK